MIDMQISTNGLTSRHPSKIRLALLCVFTFVFMATFAFLATSHQDKTEAASTAGFRAGNIISDAVMSDYNSMNINEIQAFLKSKNSCNLSADPGTVGAIRYDSGSWTILGVTYNRKYYFNTSKGVASAYYHVKDGHFVCLADETINGKSAAYHIWDSAQTFKINPKVLIVLLEKEQSLITDKFPNHAQYQGATGYGYPDSGDPDPTFFGLESQLANAANLFRVVLNGGWTNYPLGKNYIQYNANAACGGSIVNIENLATSALYRYTPYQPNAASLAVGYGTTNDGCGAYGNRNFYLLYTDWFGSTQTGTKYNMTEASEKQSALSSLGSSSYQLSPASSSKEALDISGGVSSSSKSGTLITYQKRNTSILNQSFVFKYDSDARYYYIENPTSGLRMDVSGASSADGAEVLLWSKHIGCNQKWTIKEVSGKYAFLSSCSNKALTVQNHKLIIKTYTGDSSQLWSASAVPATAVSFESNGKYQLLNAANTKLSLDLSGGVAVIRPSYSAILYDARTSNNANQAFSFQYNEATDSFRIVNPTTSLSLDVTASKTANGTKVILWASHSACNQQWKITKGSDGLYTISSLCSNKPLSTSGSTPKATDDAVIYSKTDNTTKWQIKKI